MDQPVSVLYVLDFTIVFGGLPRELQRGNGRILEQVVP
jgi:hypothetical protein